MVCESADIKGDVAANAASEPCRPMTTTTMTATSRRFIKQSLAVATDRSKLSLLATTSRAAPYC